MSTSITAIGTANPVYKCEQLVAADLISTTLNLKPAERRLLKSVYKATGIEYRHSVLSDFCQIYGRSESAPDDYNGLLATTAERMKIYKDNALQLAITAIENCIANLTDFSFAQITHLITVSCTGMYAPGIDIEIVQQLKLNSSVKRTMINFMGCYGAFNALKVADDICLANPDAKVLVICLELCTIHFPRNIDKETIVSSAVFADGAAAVLIESQAKTHKHFSMEHFHCDLFPQTSSAMAWHIADFGFDIVLSSYVAELIQAGISAFTTNMLQQQQLKLADIDFFAIHPGGKKILEACEESLGISKEQNKYSYNVLKNYGNMSSATVLFVLKEILMDVNYKDNNKNIFSCAFGPGLTLESMLLKVHHA
jgi:alpha-pyrone synthase